MKIYISTLIFLFLSFFPIEQIFAQNEYKSPKKAALYSIVPGAGQIYTKKYWKVPIIYTALLTTSYFIYDNNKNYHKYKDTYLNRINGINDNLNYTNSELITLKDYYKRNREISIMLFSLSYILNIIDASVNAHLFEYEIDENISFKVEPLIKNFNQAHISLKINI